MIYYGNGLNESIGLKEATVAFSHCDYPKLIAALAALSAKIFGYWNEYIPKTGLAVLFVTVLIGISEIRFVSRYSKTAIFFAVMFMGFMFYGNGVADGWLAVFVLLGDIYIIEYFITGNRTSLISGILSILLLPQIKNEGYPLMLINFFIFGLIFLMLYKSKNLFNMINKPANKKTIFSSLISCIPIITWLIHKTNWGLDNDLGLFNRGVVEEALNSLLSNERNIIINSLIHESHMDLLAVITATLFLTAVIVSFFKGNACYICLKTFALTFFMLVMTANIYLACLFIVYLVTPLKLSYHLDASTYRVMMTSNFLYVFSCIYSACFLFEKKGCFQSAECGTQLRSVRI